MLQFAEGVTACYFRFFNYIYMCVYLFVSSLCHYADAENELHIYILSICISLAIMQRIKIELDIVLIITLFLPNEIVNLCRISYKCSWSS